ncbi:MAG: phosphatidylserine decarboxylase [Clostridiales bacterium]|nr:phosphatidylserine decarboxylase [Clostridiales bacterium]
MTRHKILLGTLLVFLSALFVIPLVWVAITPHAFLPPQPIPDEQASAALIPARQPITLELMAILEQQPQLKELLEKSLALARERNPDSATNPAQSLEEYLDFLDRSVRIMPWEGLGDALDSSLYNQIDQSLNYFYFLMDQPLPELKNRGYLKPSLQYMEELRPWIVKYAKAWGAFLSTPESWNREHLERVSREERFGLGKGWYESPDNWRSWNDFFARRLRTPQARPIASPQDDSLLASPADSTSQGLWAIDGHSMIVPKAVLKSTVFQSIPQLLGEDSAYQNAFAGGTLTHTFLDVHDYHRFHFPLSGVVREVRLIAADAAVGGEVLWDPQQKRYVLLSTEPGWQSIESRACVILENPAFGLVALLPIGMSQVSSVVLDHSVQTGAKVHKGDPLGCFYFGGSDIVMIFQKGIKLELLMPKTQDATGYAHVLMGEPYGRLSGSS